MLASIAEQGKLTTELRNAVEAAATMVAVEDLYRPYRPKRRTRATIAKEKGLESLANILLLQMTKKPLEEEAADYISEEKGVGSAQEALEGAKDILAEMISDSADYRTYIRKLTMNEGKLSLKPEMKRKNPFTKIIMTMKKLSVRFRGIGFWRLTGEKKKSF